MLCCTCVLFSVTYVRVRALNKSACASPNSLLIVF